MRISYYLNLILLGKIRHIVHVQGSHQDLGSRTTLYARALPIHHTGDDENTQTADPVLSLLSQPGYRSQGGSGPFK